MKRLYALCLLLAGTLIVCTCASTGGGSGYGLYDAIEQTAEQIAENLPAGSRVAIVAFESEHNNISDYIMEELTGALFDRKIEVADRQNLEYVYQELNFQMSGDVSDETAKSIGKFLAADMVITGQMLNLDSMYRYRTSAVNVETAVRASVTRLDVRSDRATKRMFAAIARQQTTTKVAKYGVSADVTPQTAGTFLDRGIMFASRGEFEMAIADFDEAIRLNPDMAAAYALRARALAASASRVTHIADDFSDIYVSVTRGIEASAEQIRKFEMAIADYTQAIRLDPDNGDLYQERGEAHSHKGDIDTAIADFNQAIRLNPNNKSAYDSRGTAYDAKGDFDRAIADFNEAIRLDPNDAIPYNQRGVTYNNKGDYDRAITDFNEAIRLDPNYAGTYDNRGFVYYNKGDYDRAIADYTQAIRLDPNRVVSYNNRGIAYYNKGDYDRAIADFEAAVRIDPNYSPAKGNNASVYNERGVEYYNRGDYDRAFADFAASVRLNPNDSTAKGNFDHVRRELQTRAIEYYNKKDYDRVIADCNALLRTEPNNTTALKYRGYAYYDKRDYDRAIADFEAALRIAPNDDNAKRWLDSARQARGR